jgi:hypothetical protein
MERATVRSAVAFVGNQATTAVAFARQLVEAGFERENPIVRMASNIADDLQNLEGLLADALAESENESTGPVVDGSDDDSAAKIELVD